MAKYNEHPMCRIKIIKMMASRGYTSVSELLDDPNLYLGWSYRKQAFIMLKEEREKHKEEK
jgi:hypothetical protein